MTLWIVDSEVELVPDDEPEGVADALMAHLKGSGAMNAVVASGAGSDRLTASFVMNTAQTAAEAEGSARALLGSAEGVVGANEVQVEEV